MTKFISIASSKGGVGKTTTAINLGTALTTFSRDVIVVDANMFAPDLLMYLGAPNVPITLHDVLDRDKKITDALYMHSHGLKIVPASSAIKDIKEIDYEKLHRAIKSLSGMTEYVIVDTAAGLGDEAINGMKIGDEVIIVTTPQLPAVSDALRTIKKAKEHGKKVIGVVLTRVFDDELELKKADVEAILEVPVLGVIPEDDFIRESVQIKSPVTYTHPNAPSSLGYKQLAAKILGEKFVQSVEKKDTMMETMFKKLGLK